MKIIARTLIILAAALLVCGATFALGSSGAVQTTLPGRGGPGPFGNGQPSGQRGPGGRGNQGNGIRGTAPNGAQGLPGRPPVDGGPRGNGFAVMDVFQNLAIVAAIVAVVAPLLQLLRRRTKTARSRQLDPPVMVE